MGAVERNEWSIRSTWPTQDDCIGKLAKESQSPIYSGMGLKLMSFDEEGGAVRWHIRIS